TEAAEREPVAIPQHHVGHDDVEFAAEEQVGGLGVGFRLDHARALPAQVHGEGAADSVLVVDEKRSHPRKRPGSGHGHRQPPTGGRVRAASRSTDGSPVTGFELVVPSGHCFPLLYTESCAVSSAAGPSGGDPVRSRRMTAASAGRRTDDATGPVSPPNPDAVPGRIRIRGWAHLGFRIGGFGNLAFAVGCGGGPGLLPGPALVPAPTGSPERSREPPPDGGRGGLRRRGAAATLPQTALRLRLRGPNPHQGGPVDDSVAKDAKRLLLRYGAPIAVVDQLSD